MEGVSEEDRPLILVADDEDDVRALIVGHLVESGYDVLEASGGEQALTLCMERQPVLAILDVKMPGLDGYEVTRRLRDSADTQEMRIIILTAQTGARDVTQGFEVGADDYIKKPISPSELRARVHDILGQ